MDVSSLVLTSLIFNVSGSSSHLLDSLPDTKL